MQVQMLRGWVVRGLVVRALVIRGLVIRESVVQGPVVQGNLSSFFNPPNSESVGYLRRTPQLCTQYIHSVLYSTVLSFMNFISAMFDVKVALISVIPPRVENCKL